MCRVSRASPWAFNYGADRFSLLSASAGRYGYAELFESTQKVGSFINHVLPSNGSTQVDLVGHSQGGTLTKPFVMGHGGAEQVRRVVTLGATLRGTDISGWDWGGSALESTPGSWRVLADDAAGQHLLPSDFVAWLGRLPDADPEISYLPSTPRPTPSRLPSRPP